MVSEIDSVVEEVAVTTGSTTIETKIRTIVHRYIQVSEAAMNVKVKIPIIDHPQIIVKEEAATMTTGSQENKTRASQAMNNEVEGLIDRQEVEVVIEMIFREKSPTRIKTTPQKIHWTTKKKNLKLTRKICLRDQMASMAVIEVVEVAREAVADAARPTKEVVHTTRGI